MIPYCNHTGVGLIPWSPVARRALTRPWGGRDTLRETTDNYLKSMIRGREDKTDEEIVNRVEKVAKKMGKSMDEAVEAVNIQLDPKDMEFLEEAYVPKKRQGY